MNNATESLMQCWGCPVFDRLLGVISNAAASVYGQLTLFAGLLFCIFFAFFILNAVWKNIRGSGDDPMYQKSVKPLIINSLVVFALLGAGVMLPRFVSRVTFEPATDIATIYVQTMTNTNTQMVDELVPYKLLKMDDGFYRPQLRDKIITLMKTTVVQFQNYVKLGIAVMDGAFTWDALYGISSLIKHIIMFAVGLYLVYGFFRLFIKFCFYFVDVIVAMTFFAFFFPLSLVMFAFKGNPDTPKWMQNIGQGFGADQFKKVIGAIMSLAAAVLTYTIIMAIITKFFSDPDGTNTELMRMITSGELYDGAISDDNLATMTIGGCAVLLYVVNFIADKIPDITKEVMDTFGVKEEHSVGDALADDVLKVTGNIVKFTTDTAKKFIGSGEKKEEKKEEKK